MLLAWCFVFRRYALSQLATTGKYSVVVHHQVQSWLYTHMQDFKIYANEFRYWIVTPFPFEF